jgi:hypothetical protein
MSNAARTRLVPLNASRYRSYNNTNGSPNLILPLRSGNEVDASKTGTDVSG